MKTNLGNQWFCYQGGAYKPGPAWHNCLMNDTNKLAKTTSKLSKTSLVDSIAEATSTAYMFDDYGTSWKRCIRILLGYGLSPKQVEAVLLSKHMRWADDSEGRGNGNKTNSAAFDRYLQSWMMAKGGQAWQEEVQQLTTETFGGGQ